MLHTCSVYMYACIKYRYLYPPYIHKHMLYNINIHMLCNNRMYMIYITNTIYLYTIYVMYKVNMLRTCTAVKEATFEKPLARLLLVRLYVYVICVYIYVICVIHVYVYYMYGVRMLYAVYM